MGKKKNSFQDVATVLRRFGPDNSCAIHEYRSFLQDGLDKNHNEDELVRMVRDSNVDSEAGRSATCWVIGDRDFVQKAINSSDQARLRISRFEKEGCDLDTISERVAKKLKIDKHYIKHRCRGGAASTARKLFVHTAINVYRAPSRIVADYCGVGIAAVSVMSRQGRQIADTTNFLI